MVGYSFVQTPEDVRLLQREREARGRHRMPIVLKIETRVGVQNLPRLTELHAWGGDPRLDASTTGA